MEEQHGVVNPEVETIKSVQSESLQNVFESLDVKNYEIRQTMQRTQTKDNILTWHEAHEINGVLRIDEQQTSEDTVENIENHIRGGSRIFCTFVKIFVAIQQGYNVFFLGGGGGWCYL